MGAVAAHGDHAPEPVRHLPAGNAPPDMLDIPFIAALVDHHRLLILPAPPGNLVQHLGLDTGVGHVRPGKIPVFEAVVVGQQMAVRVLRRHKLLNLFPILYRLGPAQVILVCEAPPHIGKRGETAQQILQINQIILLRHLGKSPSVIRVK